MSQHLINIHCECAVCLGSYDKEIQCNYINPISSNSLQQFLELFPKNFPIAIINTIFPKSKVYFFNKFSSILNIVPYKKITQHLPLATNVILFYPRKSIIAYKYQLLKYDPSYIYVQAYYHRIPTNIIYDRCQIFTDLSPFQKLETFVKQIIIDQNYDLTQSNKQFIISIHKQYGDITFCKFMTKFYCTFIQNMCNLIIFKGQFQWIIQKLGLIRLANVKNLVLQKLKKHKTFQQQYQQKILQKLKSQSTIEQKPPTITGKKYKINHRINAFRNQIQNMYNRQKQKIFQKIQKQRTLQTKTKSDQIAKLFLPQLQKYSSLKQVLNDQQKFKKVVLGINQYTKSSIDGLNHKRIIKSTCPSRTKSLFTKYRNSKTQI